MSAFDGASVDKDLLSQIFADDDDESTLESDALLDEMLKDAEQDVLQKKEETAPDLEAMMRELQLGAGQEELEEPSPESPVQEEVLAPEESLPSEPVLPEEEAEEPEPEPEAAQALEAEPEEAVLPQETMPEEAVLEETIPETEAAAEPEPEAEVALAGQEEEAAKKRLPAFETSIEGDTVIQEAKEMMEAERKAGTITTITAGTKISGSISADNSLEMMGTITGDVECQGKISIVGKVSGNVSAADIYVSTQCLEGSLSSAGVVKIGVGTVILGNIKAASAYLAGAVKGDIDVNGHVVIDSTAIIQGNVTAKSIQVNNGAIIDGSYSLQYANVSLDDFFDGREV